MHMGQRGEVLSRSVGNLLNQTLAGSPCSAKFQNFLYREGGTEAQIAKYREI